MQRTHLQSRFDSREVVLAVIALKGEAEFGKLGMLALVWTQNAAL